MKKMANPWPAPKRGKARSFMKSMRSKPPSNRKNVPYVRHNDGPLKFDRWKNRLGHSVQELTHMTGRKLIQFLRSDGILPEWNKQLCPRCGKGTFRLHVLLQSARARSVGHSNTTVCITYRNLHFSKNIPTQQSASPTTTHTFQQVSIRVRPHILRAGGFYIRYSNWLALSASLTEIARLHRSQSLLTPHGHCPPHGHCDNV